MKKTLKCFKEEDRRLGSKDGGADRHVLKTI